MGPLGDFSLITFHDGEFTQNEFERALDFGNPILIRGANKRLQPASWEPNEFAERYGSDTVSPIDTTTDQPVRPMKASAFFEMLANEDLRMGRLKLKVIHIVLYHRK